MERYGVDNVFATKQVKEKIKQTNLNRYGRYNVGQFGSPEHNKAMIKKYGTIHSMQSETVKEKAKKTFNEKYGVDWYTQSREKRVQDSKVWRIYLLSELNDCGVQWTSDATNENVIEELCFDSAWELAYYIWLKDNNIDFNYQCEPIPYTSYNGKIHYYIPDFKVGDDLIEIKGPQFFTESGQLINPYDRSEEADLHNQKKYECMLNHKVIILTDVKDQIKYVKDKYGEDFLKSCKRLP